MATMARRSASARPIAGSALSASKVPVVSLTAAFEFDRPVRHEQRPRARIEEGPRETRQRLGARPVAGGGVAGRQHDEIGVELELGDLARGEETVILAARLLGQAERERGLRQALHFARDETVGREIDDAVAIELVVFDRGLARRLAEMDLACRRAEALGDRLELPRGLGQRRQAAPQRLHIDTGPAEIGGITALGARHLDAGAFLPEDGIAVADEGLRRRRGLGHHAQGAQRRDRRQHADGALAREPRHVAVIGKALDRRLRRARHEQMEGQARQRVRRHDDEALLAAYGLLDRTEQRRVKLVRLVHVEQLRRALRALQLAQVKGVAQRLHTYCSSLSASTSSGFQTICSLVSANTKLPWPVMR